MRDELFKKYPACEEVCTRNVQAPPFVTLCISLLLLLSACTPRSIYLNENFNPPVYFGQHVVKSGDTLYSIAWRYGRDMKELAFQNQLKPPYVIQPGQKITLERVFKEPNNHLKNTRVASNRKRNVTERKETKQNSKSVTKNKKTKVIKNIKWQWPHLGPILAKYSIRTSRTNGMTKGKSAGASLNKGVDITGSLGSPILAAADGEVVYAGSGLLGYGNLVIINHNETYLSAYAHNRRILVKEGQIIKRGHKIAEMGSSDSQQVMLHFEIRQNGEPVDPMKFLPRR